MTRHAPRSARSRRGQAAVETAIVMPLFVFLILGMIQLGLMHQARVMTKYAAFKAVRVGSIHNAKQEAMKKAAMAVLLPMAGRRAGQSFFKASPDSGFAQSWATVKSNISDHLDLTICNPTGNYYDDFDNPAGALGRNTSDWETANRGRLSIQLTFYYQLVIPFVNGVLWHIVAGQENTELMRTLRLSPENPKWRMTGGSRTVSSFADKAKQHIYILPIRASWSMRMQSNYLPKYKLPNKNLCRIGWRPPGYSP
jgi:Flp pilus assembly protein TadG